MASAENNAPIEVDSDDSEPVGSKTNRSWTRSERTVIIDECFHNRIPLREMAERFNVDENSIKKVLRAGKCYFKEMDLGYFDEKRRAAIVKLWVEDDVPLHVLANEYAEHELNASTIKNWIKTAYGDTYSIDSIPSEDFLSYLEQKQNFSPEKFWSKNFFG